MIEWTEYESLLKLLLSQGITGALLLLFAGWTILKGFPAFCSLIERIFAHHAGLLERQGAVLNQVSERLLRQTQVLEGIEQILRIQAQAAQHEPTIVEAVHNVVTTRHRRRASAAQSVEQKS
jgi:hypothetical protein